MEHIYTLEGSRIVSEAWGNNLLVYLYDENGAPIGMQYRNTTYAKDRFDTFYFEKNLQGDVVAVYNSMGDPVVYYSYDAWGNQTITWRNSYGPNFNASYNPFRYRGYYYDTETGLYYLQSRYYNPATGRFINADGQLNPGLLGCNMYAYCNNNPVMGTDESGRGWLGAGLGAACGAIIGGIFGALDAIVSGESIEAGILMGAINGAICGAIGGSIAEDIATGGISSIGTAQMLLLVGGCFVSGALTDIGAQAINSGSFEFNNIDWGSAVESGTQNVIITALSLLVPGPGTSEIAGTIAVNCVYNLFSSTGQWIYNTIQEQCDQRKEATEDPYNEVVPID